MLGLDPNAGAFEVRVPGLASAVEGALAFNVETLEARPAVMRREGEDLVLPLDWRWFMVVLQEKGCRPLVSVGELPTAWPGGTLTLNLQVLPGQEFSGTTSPVLSAPGLGVSREVGVPGTVALDIPAGTKPGWYLMTLDGPSVLGCKRFLQVKEA